MCCPVLCCAQPSAVMGYAVRYHVLCCATLCDSMCCDVLCCNQLLYCARCQRTCYAVLSCALCLRMCSAVRYVRRPKISYQTAKHVIVRLGHSGTHPKHCQEYKKIGSWSPFLYIRFSLWPYHTLWFVPKLDLFSCHLSCVLYHIDAKHYNLDFSHNITWGLQKSVSY